MLKLTPILEEVPEDICMSGYEGSGGHDRKLHQALPFHIGGGIGPESITRKSEMANHNSRVKESSCRLDAGPPSRQPDRQGSCSRAAQQGPCNKGPMVFISAAGTMDLLF